MAAFAFETEALAASRVEPHPLGRALHAPDLHQMWVLNQLQVLGPQPELEPGALVAQLDRLYGHVVHRRAVVPDDATGLRLRDGLAALRFEPGPVEVMTLAAAPPAQPGIAVREADAATTRELDRRIAVDDGHHGAVLDTLLAGRARLRGARPGTRVFAGARHGADACTVTLYRGEGFAQVEEVGTLRAHRRHGLAGATVAHAAREAFAAGAREVFLFVALDDGPVGLYERVGFRRTGHRCWTFTRPV